MPPALGQHELIALLERYGTVPSAAAARLLGVSHNAVKKRARVLRKKRVLLILPMPTGGVYYTPTNRHRRKAGLPVKRREAAVHHLLLHAVGTAYACARADLLKLTPAEVEADYPGCAVPGHYAQDPAGRLHLLVVAHAGNPRSLAAKAEHAVAKRLRVPAFEARIRAGHFAVTVVVPTAGLADDVRAVLRGRAIDPAVAVAPLVVPELAPFLLFGD